MNSETKKLDRSIKISVLGAIAFILMFIEVPVIPLFPWLKMDLSEVPVLMGAFAFGTLSGIVIEILKLVLHLLIKGTSTGGIGELANFLVGAAFILPASIIYNKHRSKKTAIIGMIVGALVIISNVYLLLPAYGMQMDSAYLMKYVTIGLLPFNGIKAVVVSIITFILYRRVSASVFKVQSNFGDNKKIENRV